MRSFLQIEPASPYSVRVDEQLDFNTRAFQNRLWYEGSAYELSQFFKQILSNSYGFWASVPTVGLGIRKIHTGVPRLIVNSLTNIISHDFNGLEFESKAQEELWEKIVKDNKFDKLLRRATREALIVGDGAFKINFDEKASKLPIIEWFAGDRVEYVYLRGRLQEIVFLTEYVRNKDKYILRERYGFGYVKYELTKDDKPVDKSIFPHLAELEDVTFDKSVMLASQFLITDSERFEGRGQSIFDGKSDNFDALDEAFSQWIHAMREGRAKKYIPKSLIPRDPHTGELMCPSDFDNQFIAVEDGMGENAKNEITLHQPTFPSADYLSTYITALDLCLQGVISPSTLGIDVKKLDNAEAQREKEKATLYTRGNIIEALTDTLQALAYACINAEAAQKKTALEEVSADVLFGEYANPSFEAVVETVGKAAQNGIMSIETQIEELYGDSKDDEWKAQEVARVKELKGIVQMKEPGLADPWGITEEDEVTE